MRLHARCAARGRSAHEPRTSPRGDRGVPGEGRCCARRATGTPVCVDPELREFLIGHYPPAPEATDVIPHFSCTPVGIRFELSGISGTYSAELDRCRTDDELAPIIQQAGDRATTLFEATFAKGDRGWMVARSDYAQSLRDRVGRIRSPSRRRAVRWLEEVLPAAARESLAVEVVADLPGDDEYHPRRLLEATIATDLRATGYQEILPRIAAAELGGDVRVWETYFVSRTTGVVFHMYDDRGLDIMAPRPEPIRAIYREFTDWILDHDRQRIDATFA